LGATASAPRYFSVFSLGNTTFNPQIGINANYGFTSVPSGTGTWTLTIYSGSTAVRTITGSGVKGSPVWNGQDGGGASLPPGNYTYAVDCTAGGSTASPLRGRVTLSTTLQFAVNNLAVAPAFFSPNADGVQDTTTISGVCTFDGASWSLTVRNSGGTSVHTASGAANPNISYTWNGGTRGNGIYTLELVVTDGSASVTYSPTATLDKTLPVATITAPTGPTLSNITQSGSSNVNVIGSSTDTNFLSWALEYGPGAAPGSWTSLATGTSPISSGTFASWATLLIANGQYTLRLTSNDKAGNKATATRTMSIGNFNVTGGSQPLNPTTGGTVSFTSIVPNLSPTTVSETLEIRKSQGTTVKTLWSGARTPGSYVDVWDGKLNPTTYTATGVYTAVATATAGASSMTWNPGPVSTADTTPLIFEDFGWSWPIDFWPFNNKPLPLNYTLPSVWNPPRPTRVWILFTPQPLTVWNHGMARLSMCSTPGNFCYPAGEYQMTGPRTVLWNGLDSTRTVRTDITAAVIMAIHEKADGNVIQVGGSEPGIAGLQLTPTLFRPGNGNLQISFGASTFQSGTLSGTITIERLDVIGALRTITIPSQAPGSKSFLWDGRTDSGLQLAEGRYLVTVSISDVLGSVKKEQRLITIAY
jgi:flagellar hook assembly protein FlgD